MIRNGCVRSEDGIWFTVEGLDRIVVNRGDPEYEGDQDMCWQIEAIFSIDGEESGIVIESNFTHPEDAQNALDHMMQS